MNGTSVWLSEPQAPGRVGVLISAPNPDHLVLSNPERCQDRDEFVVTLGEHCRALIGIGAEFPANIDCLFGVEYQQTWHRAMKYRDKEAFLFDTCQIVPIPEDNEKMIFLPKRFGPDRIPPFATLCHIPDMKVDSEEMSNEANKYLQGYVGHTLTVTPRGPKPVLNKEGFLSWPIDLSAEVSVAEKPFASFKKVVKYISAELHAKGLAKLLDEDDDNEQDTESALGSTLTPSSDSAADAEEIEPPEEEHPVLAWQPVPAPQERRFRVRFTNVTGAGILVGHCYEDRFQLRSVRTRLNRIADILQGKDHWRVGDACALHYCDGYNEWVRGTVTSIQGGQGTATVLLIDYGNTISHPTRDLYVVPYNCVDAPALAYYFLLQDVSPPRNQMTYDVRKEIFHHISYEYISEPMYVELYPEQSKKFPLLCKIYKDNEDLSAYLVRSSIYARVNPVQSKEDAVFYQNSVKAKMT